MGGRCAPFSSLKRMARVTGLEPATSGVTGRHSNQLSYTRVARREDMRPGEGRRLGGEAGYCQAIRLWITEKIARPPLLGRSGGLRRRHGAGDPAVHRQV